MKTSALTPAMLTILFVLVVPAKVVRAEMQTFISTDVPKAILDDTH
jgi:hypothetical protein